MSTSYLWTDSKSNKLLAALSRGCSRRQACRAAGIGKSAFYERLKVDEAFQVEVEEAEAAATDDVEHALWKKAMDGNVTAMIYYLQNRRPERWQDRRAVRSHSTVDVSMGYAEVDAYNRLCAEHQEALEEQAREALAIAYEAELAAAAG